MARVGVRQVARHAGVSVGTVSNVVNMLPSVRPEIAERVHASIAHLGFVPNDSARQLQSGQSHTIALVVLSSFNPFFNALAEYAEDAAETRGLSLILASSAQREERERRYLALFERQRVRGVLLAPLAGVPSYVKEIHHRGTPIVLLGANGRADGFCSVSVDSEASGYAAVRHLISTGRRRIAVVGGPAHQIEERVRGAQRAASEVGGVELDLIETVDLTVEQGARVGADLARRERGRIPDGVFCANDLVAIGLINCLVRQEHVRIPEDIAVVGHDDIMFASASAVPITTMRQPLASMADLAVTLLEREASESHDHVHRQVVVPTELVTRDSAP